MAVINNLAAYGAAISAVCPINGVDVSGKIDFDPAATPSQIAAAQAVAAAYSDTPAQVISMQSVLAAMTDAEYQAIVQLAATQLATKPALHRAIFSQQKIDLSKPAVQTLIQALVTASVITAQRAQMLFAPPPVSVIISTAPDVLVSHVQAGMFQAVELPAAE